MQKVSGKKTQPRFQPQTLGPPVSSVPFPHLLGKNSRDPPSSRPVLEGAGQGLQPCKGGRVPSEDQVGGARDPLSCWSGFLTVLLPAEQILCPGWKFGPSLSFLPLDFNLAQSQGSAKLSEHGGCGLDCSGPRKELMLPSTLEVK